MELFADPQVSQNTQSFPKLRMRYLEIKAQSQEQGFLTGSTEGPPVGTPADKFQGFHEHPEILWKMTDLGSHALFFFNRESLAFIRCTKWIQACPLLKQWKEPLVYKVWYKEKVAISLWEWWSLLFPSSVQEYPQRRIGSKMVHGVHIPLNWHCSV